MRNTTINTINVTAFNGLANVIVVGVTATLRDLRERLARGSDAAARYGLAVLTGSQPAGPSWQPEMCPASMPAHSQRHNGRPVSGFAVKRGTVGRG
jgi:hypothetical protein